MLFNVNDIVRVRLTDHGRALLEAEHHLYWAKQAGTYRPPYEAPKETSDGWSKWQLWVLMSKFGEHTGNGRTPCFETFIGVPEMKKEQEMDSNPAEKSIHEAMRSLAQAIFNEQGISVQLVRFSWLNTSTAGEKRMLVTGVDLDSST